jgi:hypothetical protein
MFSFLQLGVMPGPGTPRPGTPASSDLERATAARPGAGRHQSGGTSATVVARLCSSGVRPARRGGTAAAEGRDGFLDRCAQATHGDSLQRPRSKEPTDERFRRSTAVWWAWLDLNQRPHPYQVSRAQRCADRCFPRSPPSVRAEGMRSNALDRKCHRWRLR